MHTEHKDVHGCAHGYRRSLCVPAVQPFWSRSLQDLRSSTRDWTWASVVKSLSSNPWTTREFPAQPFLTHPPRMPPTSLSPTWSVFCTLKTKRELQDTATPLCRSNLPGGLMPALPSFSLSVMSDFLRSHGLQHLRLHCPLLSPGFFSDSCLFSWWCHPAISSSVTPFSSCPQSCPASGSFPMSWLFALGCQSVEASVIVSVLPMNIQSWFP